MSFKIIIEPSGHEFQPEGKETILRAGMRSGLNLAHNCMNGSCGKCLAELKQGKIEQVRHHDFRLSDQQKNDQQFLTCCHQPLSDLVLNMHELDTVQQIPYQEITVKVSRTELLADDVMHLQLRTSRSNVLDFLAGQKVQLTLKDTSSITLGVSSCPCDGLNLRFHFRNTGEERCNRIFTQFRKGEKLLISGPYGDFTLDESSDRPLIFLAWDTGFAQVQSIIDHVISESPERDIQLFWFSDKSHYFENYCRSWSDVLDNFHYETIDCDLSKLAVVVNAKIETASGLENHDIYSILPENDLSVLAKTLAESGFPAQQLHIEAC